MTIDNPYHIKPIRMNLSGDKELAASYSGEAKRILFQLRNIQKTSNAIQELTKRFEDGTIINVHSKVNGMDVVNIFHPVITNKIYEDEKWIEEQIKFPVLMLKSIYDYFTKPLEPNVAGVYVADNFYGDYGEFVEKNDKGKYEYTNKIMQNDDNIIVTRDLKEIIYDKDKNPNSIAKNNSQFLHDYSPDGIIGDDNGIIFSVETTQVTEFIYKGEFKLSGIIDYFLFETYGSVAHPYNIDELPSEGFNTSTGILTSVVDDKIMFIYCTQTPVLHIENFVDWIYHLPEKNTIKVVINKEETICYSGKWHDSTDVIYCNIFKYNDDYVYVYGYLVGSENYVEFCSVYKNKTNKIKFKLYFDYFANTNNYYRYTYNRYNFSDNATVTTDTLKEIDITFPKKMEKLYGYSYCLYNYGPRDLQLFEHIILGEITKKTKRKVT